ncbi:MAG: hypothetical protein QME93_07880 [Bacillota bacterium]|nr:hypothetical protein [Bacillota bacterium]MDI7249972.1 hypothetical protein [Bacillota bacterium]
MRRCAGVWPGEEEVFGCLFGRGPSGPRLLGKARAPLLLRPGGVEDGLRSVLRALGRSALVVSCHGPDVAVRCLRVPRLPPQDVASAASWEMQLLLGERKERVIVRHALLGPLGDGLGVLAAAVPEDSVRAVLQPFTGRRVRAVDLDACALWRAAAFGGVVPSADAPVALAAPSGEGAVVVSGREFPEFALALPGRTARELDRAVGYHEAQERVKVSARLWAGPEPPEGWQALELPGLEPEFAPAAGLALWPWFEPRVDLMTRDMKEGARARQVLPWLVVGVLAACSVGTGELALLYRSQAARASREAAVLAPTVRRSEQAEKDAADFRSWADLASSFLASLPSRSSLLEAVRLAVPPDAWLTRVDLLPAGTAGEGKAGKNGPELPPAGGQLVVEGRSLSLSAAGVVRDGLRRSLRCEVRVVRLAWDDSLGCYSFRVEALLGGEAR